MDLLCAFIVFFVKKKGLGLNMKAERRPKVQKPARLFAVHPAELDFCSQDEQKKLAWLGKIEKIV